MAWLPEHDGLLPYYLIYVRPLPHNHPITELPP